MYIDSLLCGSLWERLLGAECYLYGKCIVTHLIKKASPEDPAKP